MSTPAFWSVKVSPPMSYSVMSVVSHCHVRHFPRPTVGMEEFMIYLGNKQTSDGYYHHEVYELYQPSLQSNEQSKEPNVWNSQLKIFRKIHIYCVLVHGAVHVFVFFRHMNTYCSQHNLHTKNIHRVSVLVDTLRDLLKHQLLYIFWMLYFISHTITSN